MRRWLAPFLILAIVGCGAKSRLDGTPGAGAAGAGGAGAGGESPDAGDAGDASEEGDAAPMGPIPTCDSLGSKCIQIPEGWAGAVIVQCQPVDFVGPWKLLLQREAAGQFHTVMSQIVQEPGFGWTFHDIYAPAAMLTYRVCVSDTYGVRCGQPFGSESPPDCSCKPITCSELTACNVTIDNGCGSTVQCGVCQGSELCNEFHSCCPPMFYSDLHGGCVCAPPGGCDWDTSQCACSGGSPGQ